MFKKSKEEGKRMKLKRLNSKWNCKLYILSAKKIKIMPDFQRIIGRTEFGALTHNWSVNNSNCPRTVEENDISGRFVNTINSLQLSLVGKKIGIKNKHKNKCENWYFPLLMKNGFHYIFWLIRVYLKTCLTTKCCWHICIS